jgi:pimeloyl-ACP methyl ester carboxylesterase
VELLDALQIKEPIVLGGLSMGGYVALALMARHPERVRALMLMDTRATADPPEAARNREILAAEVEKAKSSKAAVDAMLPKLFSEMTRQNHPELISPIKAAMEHASPRAVAGALRGMAARPDRTDLLPRITVPTLVLGGSDDAITPPDEMRKLAEGIPNARHVVVPDAGHLAPLENSGAANKAILSFLNGLP